MTIMLKINDKKELLTMVYEMRKAGLLKDVNMGVFQKECRYPIEVPIDLDGLIKIVSNPLARPFKRTIDQFLVMNFKKIQSKMA